MSRYLRIIYLFWLTSIASEIEYRINLIVEIISVIGNLIGSIFILSLFYTSGHNLGGWSWESALIVLGVYMILDGITVCFLQPNLSRIVKHIQNGTLDFILLKPIDTQTWLSLRRISPWGFPSFALGVLLIVYSLFISQAHITSCILFKSLSSLFSSIIILYSIWFIIATTSIWFVKIWNANEVLKSVLITGKYPISSYPNALRFFLTFIVPVSFMTTVPSEYFLGKDSIPTLLLSYIISIFFLFISIRFWKYALKFYTSASS